MHDALRLRRRHLSREAFSERDQPVDHEITRAYEITAGQESVAQNPGQPRQGIRCAPRIMWLGQREEMAAWREIHCTFEMGGPQCGFADQQSPRDGFTLALQGRRGCANYADRPNRTEGKNAVCDLSPCGFKYRIA
ncbi:hypothetical protein M622_19325 [Thauera terpenica 58Eu]|uniref:Uncharacterized protein n=1 Tax=Thauera terpenica 58Eu TaxID=1348657 RepID=T0ATG9_9RHOO|nr:hypothetical protein M622_19325 [Thauera terpenica 58Eu]